MLIPPAYSLYAAVSVGMTTSTILDVLDRFSKVKLTEEVISFIKDCTGSYGKVKLVLKRNRYYLESGYPKILQKLLLDPVIKEARVILTDKKMDDDVKEQLDLKKVKDEFSAVITLDREDEEEEEDNDDDQGKNSKSQNSMMTTSFEIQALLIENVKKRCTELDYPLMEEYDFRQDTVNVNLDIDLSPKTTIRDYQEKCLSKMFGGNSDGRARSGIIVLPTGAGKTLVGITAACTVKKSTIILCTNAISVEQWSRELLKWSTINEDQIAKFTSSSKERFSGDSGIVISTYTMVLEPFEIDMYRYLIQEKEPMIPKK